MADFGDVYPSRFLTGKSFPDQPMVLTIKKCVEEKGPPKEGGEPGKQWVLYFDEVSQALGLNPTNWAILRELAEAKGLENTDQLAGFRISLFKTRVKGIGGELTDAIRISPAPEAAPPPPPPKPKAERPWDVVTLLQKIRGNASGYGPEGLQVLTEAQAKAVVGLLDEALIKAGVRDDLGPDTVIRFLFHLVDATQVTVGHMNAVLRWLKKPWPVGAVQITELRNVYDTALGNITPEAPAPGEDL